MLEINKNDGNVCNIDENVADGAANERSKFNVVVQKIDGSDTI